MTKPASNPIERSIAWKNALAFGSFAILCSICVMTLTLVGFRLIHFRSTNYDVLFAGLGVGLMVRIILLPFALIQTGGIVAGILAFKKHLLARVGAVGGILALLFLIGVLWVNVSEILIDDFYDF